MRESIKIKLDDPKNANMISSKSKHSLQINGTEIAITQEYLPCSFENLKKMNYMSRVTFSLGSKFNKNLVDLRLKCDNVKIGDGVKYGLIVGNHLIWHDNYTGDNLLPVDILPFECLEYHTIDIVLYGMDIENNFDPKLFNVIGLYVDDIGNEYDSYKVKWKMFDPYTNELPHDDPLKDKRELRIMSGMCGLTITPFAHDNIIINDGGHYIISQCYDNEHIIDGIRSQMRYNMDFIIVEYGRRLCFKRIGNGKYQASIVNLSEVSVSTDIRFHTSDDYMITIISKGLYNGDNIRYTLAKQNDVYMNLMDKTTESYFGPKESIEIFIEPYIKTDIEYIYLDMETKIITGNICGELIEKTRGIYV
jgi:hypothetical protein